MTASEMIDTTDTVTAAPIDLAVRVAELKAGYTDMGMHRDYAAGQIVIARLAKARGAQHLQQGFLVGVHANGLGQVAIAVGVLRHQPPQQRQHLE